MIQRRVRASVVSPRVAAALLVALLAFPPLTAFAGDALKQGAAALKRNDLGAALPLLQRAVAEEPGNEEAHTTLALALIRAHKYEEARAEIGEAAKRSPGSPVVPYLEGQAAEAQNDWDGAIAKYRAALAIKSKYADASYALGLALRHQDKASESFTELNRGLDFARESEVPKFLAGIGLALMDMDSLNAATDSTERAVALDPDNSVTHLARGEVYLKRKVYALSQQSFQRAVQLDSLNPEAFYKLGLSYYYNQAWTDALVNFKTSVLLDSLYPEPNYYIGQLYVLAGPADKTKYTDALPYLRNYTRWRPKDGRGWVYLGEALYRQPGSDTTVTREAAYALTQAVTYLDPAGTLRTKAYLLQVKNYAYNLRDFEGAFTAFSALQAAGGKLTSEDIQLVGTLYEWHHDYGTADSLFLQAAAADSSQPDPWFKLGESKTQQREYASAIPFLRRRIEADSSGANSKQGKAYMPYFMLGQSYNQLGQGLLTASQAAGLKPDSAKVLQAEASAKFDSAAAPLRLALAANPAPEGQEAAKVHLELGTAYAKGDSVSRGLGIGEFYAVVAADSTCPEAASALYNVAYIAYGEKRFTDAATLLERARVINEKRTDILLLLAFSYLGAKDSEKAKATASRGLQLDPNNSLFKRILAPSTVPATPKKGAAQGQAGSTSTPAKK